MIVMPFSAPLSLSPPPPPPPPSPPIYLSRSLASCQISHNVSVYLQPRARADAESAEPGPGGEGKESEREGTSLESQQNFGGYTQLPLAMTDTEIDMVIAQLQYKRSVFADHSNSRRFEPGPIFFTQHSQRSLAPSLPPSLLSSLPPS
jgi:hypothetical protein